jgi:hypothetical protein
MAMSTATTPRLQIADACWVALALLHRGNPDRKSFAPEEILEGAQRLDPAHPPTELLQHINSYNVANAPPSGAGYRMFTRLEDGSLRLQRPGDAVEPFRKGKTKPEAADLPGEYRNLLRWYDDEYNQVTPGLLAEDPILGMRGLGEYLWKDESGDDFIRRERSGW